MQIYCKSMICVVCLEWFYVEWVWRVNISSDSVNIYDYETISDLNSTYECLSHFLHYITIKKKHNLKISAQNHTKNLRSKQMSYFI